MTHKVIYYKNIERCKPSLSSIPLVKVKPAVVFSLKVLHESSHVLFFSLH